MQEDKRHKIFIRLASVDKEKACDKKKVKQKRKLNQKRIVESRVEIVIKD
jgi:hypothetical protein